MAPILPSTRLVCWSSTKLSMPRSRSSACSQDRRTGSFVRSSSSSALRSENRAADCAAALDHNPGHSMLAGIRARQPPAHNCRRRGRQAERAEKAVALVASVGPQRERSRPSLDALSDLLGGDLAAVNQLILERMQSPVALIPQLAGHIVAGGGKRLRPMLTLGCARLCGYRGTRHIALAAAVEFIHTATLLHDDVVDDSDLRRGRDTANALWGNKAAVLVGDFLFSRSFELMVADGSLRVLAILSRASAVIAEGEVRQLVTANDITTTEEAYLGVVEAKTAELFAAAS